MAHDQIKDQYDGVQAEGLYEEGMARMALYHRHCQDLVIFRALGDVGGKSLLDWPATGSTPASSAERSESGSGRRPVPSTDAARRAGKTQASAVTALSVKVVTSITRGSDGPMP